MRMTYVGMTLAAYMLASAAYAANDIESKIAVADMERIMAAHPETKSANEMLQKQSDEFDNEIREMRTKLERLQEEMLQARDASESKALSDEGRAKKREEAEEKLISLRDYDKECQQTSLQRRRQLLDRERRMKDRIVGKIRDVIQAYARVKGLVLVLDSGAVLDNAGAVLYNTDKLDVTADIVKIVSKQTVSKDEMEKTKEDAPAKTGRSGGAERAAPAAKAETAESDARAGSPTP